MARNKGMSKLLTVEFCVGAAMALVLYILDKSGKGNGGLAITLLILITAFLIHPALNIPWIWSGSDPAMKAWRVCAIVCFITLAVAWFGIWTWPESDKPVTIDAAEQDKKIMESIPEHTGLVIMHSQPGSTANISNVTAINADRSIHLHDVGDTNIKGVQLLRDNETPSSSSLSQTLIDEFRDHEARIMRLPEGEREQQRQVFADLQRKVIAAQGKERERLLRDLHNLP
jgi:hypothetical protein